jgi:hypothetical protein
VHSSFDRPDPKGKKQQSNSPQKKIYKCIITDRYFPTASINARFARALK